MKIDLKIQIFERLPLRDSCRLFWVSMHRFYSIVTCELWCRCLYYIKLYDSNLIYIATRITRNRVIIINISKHRKGFISMWWFDWKKICSLMEKLTMVLLITINSIKIFSRHINSSLFYSSSYLKKSEREKNRRYRSLKSGCKFFWLWLLYLTYFCSHGTMNPF